MTEFLYQDDDDDDDNQRQNNLNIRELSNFVIKCNLCNYTFITIDQFIVHNNSQDHILSQTRLGIYEF